MKFNKIQVKNWGNFVDISLDCEDFLITGASDTGKSSLMKAILSFFRVRNLREGDIRDSKFPLEMIGNFIEKTGEFHLKFLKKNAEEIRYFVRYSAEWQEISEKEFQDFIQPISVFYIPSVLEESQMDYLFERVFQNEKLSSFLGRVSRS